MIGRDGSQRETYDFLKECGAFFVAADDGRCEVLYFGEGTTAVIAAFGEEPRTIVF